MPLYNEYKKDLMGAVHSHTADTVKVALFTAYTPNIDTHTHFGDVTGAGTQASGTGYTARGKQITSPTVTKDTTNDRGVFDGADLTWTGLSIGTPSHAVLYKDTGTDATSKVIGYWTISTATNGGDYTLAFDATGIVLIT